MKKIELTPAEIEVIKQHLNGEIEVWSATDEQQEILTKVINDAEALQEEVDPDMEEQLALPDSDLVHWYYNKYKEQQGEAEQ